MVVAADTFERFSSPMAVLIVVNNVVTTSRAIQHVRVLIKVDVSNTVLISEATKSKRSVNSTHIK